MLFTTLGQGYIFLLLLAIGSLACVFEVVLVWCLNKTKNLLIRSKTKPLDSTQSSQNLNTHSRAIIFESKKVNTKNAIRKMPKGISQIIKIIAQFLLGVVRAITCVLIIYFVVLCYDYGEIRLYHFLAFAIGFCLIKILFAKLYKINHKSATLNKVK